MKIRIPGWGMVRKGFSYLRNSRSIIKEKVKQSIRLQLMLTFAICFILTSFVFGIANNIFSEKYATIDYASSMDEIDSRARNIVEQFKTRLLKITDKKDIVEIVEQEEQNDNDIKILIVDFDGKVLFKSKSATETTVDIHNIISNAMNYRIDSARGDWERKEFVSCYPINFIDARAYVVVSGIPQPYITYRTGGNSFLATIIGFGTFIFLFYYFTRKKMGYIEEVAQGLLEISKGNLQHRIDQKSEDELGSLANNVNHMAEELERKIEEERQAEKTKNELITNVSHDLRTPLTSIMGYLRLLTDDKYENQEQMKEYINIAYNKSEKLQGLIEDLFEYTKLTNQGITLQKEQVSINELLEQLMDELSPIAEENTLVFNKQMPSEKIMLDIDVDKMVRVFENLLMNAIRYSYKPGQIKVKLYRVQEKILICFQNWGDPISSEDLPRLFDRFYKGEKSRTSSAGGSGLGLAIAKNIVELHGGEIWAECEGEIISFYIAIKPS